MTPLPEQELAKLADMAFQARSATLVAITAEESALRVQLAQLAARDRADDVLDTPALYDARRIGADVLWSVWLDNKRAELNRKLALVLARKANEIKVLSRAFGRAEAANNLARLAQAERQAKRAKTQEMRLEEQTLLALGTGR